MKKERETANKYRQQALEGDLMAMNNMGVPESTTAHSMNSAILWLMTRTKEYVHQLHVIKDAEIIGKYSDASWVLNGKKGDYLCHKRRYSDARIVGTRPKYMRDVASWDSISKPCFVLTAET